jgi:two-component system chemotaxis response regulator CheY
MKKILIVDDAATIIMSLRNNLEIAGYSVESADNGSKGLEKLKSGKFDLIMTDINMPVMDGLEFIKEARKIVRFTPILILSTETSPERRAEAKQLGATGWLVKPCGGKDLLDVIKKVLP